VKGHLIPIAVSVGVACLEAQDVNLEKLINRADEALIRAKKEGRNQVVGC
ncbi:MAG: diguanylate cyclase, partial [Planctomycetes bacterium]|nr:diguanylate cyclase [Planctomycetota bacterium]